MPRPTVNYKALTFFILTYIITWVSWFSTRFIQAQLIKEILFIVGLIAPCVIALILIYTSKDKNLKNIFINKLINLRLIQLNTLPALILIPPISIIIAILLSLPFGFSIDQFTLAKSFSFNIGTMPTLLILFFASCFEELGWRGYGIESLMAKFNYFYSTIIFSIVWAMWHFPLFFVIHSYHYNILQSNPLFALNFMIGVIPFTFIINWLWKKNNYSILIAIIFHFNTNISQELFTADPVSKCIQTIVYLVIAIYLVYRDKTLFFNK